MSRLSKLQSPRGHEPLSKYLIFSYVLDWIIVIGAGIVGGALSAITPNKRPFTLEDPSISFPFSTKETISTVVLFLISVLTPIIIILVVCLLLVPGPSGAGPRRNALAWRRKLWELNTGLLGLILSCAAAFLITNGMKNLFGKPRPDLISRCEPDVDNIAKYVVGGFGNRIIEGIQLVSADICQSKDGSLVNDGFRSFPSGHSSLSFAGLTYLTLFLCSKFAIAIPFLARGNNATYPKSRATNRDSIPSTAAPNDSALSHPGSTPNGPTPDASPFSPPTPSLRDQAAAPPTYLLIIALVPMAVATYVSSTRFSDFRHHGFDILFGAIMGFLIGWFAFRWYHLPVRQGAGWSWGPRSRERAWGIGVGVRGYVGEEGWTSTFPERRGDSADLENSRRPGMFTLAPAAAGVGERPVEMLERGGERPAGESR
ncbi:MAG: hypothetical protein M1829_001700 [Trizodia sp. TS-e1964]|nr:MAG: hypothetical protein M1829_001700 [Trizodia sp. TS-e1964]